MLISSQSVDSTLSNRVVFCLWTGPEPMSLNRLRAVLSIVTNIGCPVALVTKDTLANWVLPEAPLHEAYPYLTSTHKSDYLRCYLMHYYGGGYTDIKVTTKNWHPIFQSFSASEAFAVGYPEIPNGIPHLKERAEYAHIPYQELIGLCSFVFRRQTPITTEWFHLVTDLLTSKLEFLKASPGQHPLERQGILMPDGSASRYPLRWAEMLGEIIHPLFYRYKDKILKADMMPHLADYR